MPKPVANWILIPAGNMLVEGATKTELQQLAQLSVNEMVLALGQTPPTGVSLVPNNISPATMTVPPGQPMVLATNPIFNVDAISGTPLYQNSLTIFWNDPVTGYLKTESSSDASIPFNPAAAISVDWSILGPLLTSPNNTLRQIAHNVSAFAVAADSNQNGGEVFDIGLTLTENLPGTQRVAQAVIYRKVYPRNH